MEKIKCTFAVLFLATLMSSQTTKAEDDVSVGVSADFFNKYVWRGQNLVDDWVLQPGVSIGYKNLTASFWGNLDLTDENDYEGEFSEGKFHGKGVMTAADGSRKEGQWEKGEYVEKK